MKFEIKGNYYSGAFHLPTTTGPHAVENIISKFCPADTSLKLWDCPVDYQAIESALESVSNGFRIWKKTSLQERINYFRKYQEELIKMKDNLALAISLETGKPLWESKGEVASAINHINIVIEDSLPRIEKKYIENILPNTTGRIFYKPLGPALIISPFNLPCRIPNGHILNALIAGNSILFKASEKTCITAQLITECFHAAGFPAGVINLLQGDGEMARRLLKNRIIKGVFFTGSKEVGKKILENSHQDLSKLLSLELGGKNTSILHHDANLDFAMPALLKASFSTAGQRCTATSIITIHRTIHEEFISRFHELAKKIIVDHPLDFQKDPFMGPLIDQSSVDSYLLFMGMAKREGIHEIMRGKHIDRPKKGYYVSPSIHITEKWQPESLFLQSEIFGPNITFIPYDTIEEAIHITNANEFGLVSAIFTGDHSLYQFCIDEIDSGIINFNRSTDDYSDRLPFGGIKNSGNYRPSALSAIDSCVYPIASLENILNQTSEPNTLIGLDL